MLNMLPKGIIINNIVDTLKKDPENGVVKLLETAEKSTKTKEARAMLRQVIHYYQTSATAKMQIRNLVHNTSRATLSVFAERIYDTLSTHPITLSFLKMITIAEANTIKQQRSIFPVIDLKNLNEATQAVLARLKSEGHIVLTSIVVTVENFDIVTSNEVTMLLIKHGVRAILYRLPAPDAALEAKLAEKINQIRTTRPILAFSMQKKDPQNSTSLNYIITENVNGTDYRLQLDLR
jgi:hypothetical protein